MKRDGEKKSSKTIEARSVAIPRRAVFAGLGLIAMAPLLFRAGIAHADTFGQTFDIRNIPMNRWVANYDRTDQNIRFEMSFWVGGRTVDDAGNWTLKMKFFKKIYHLYWDGRPAYWGADLIFYQDHDNHEIGRLARGALSSEIPPGKAFYLESGWITATIPNGKTSHIYTKNISLWPGEGYQPVLRDKRFDFFLRAPDSLRQGVRKHSSTEATAPLAPGTYRIRSRIDPGTCLCSGASRGGAFMYAAYSFPERNGASTSDQLWSVGLEGQPGSYSLAPTYHATKRLAISSGAGCSTERADGSATQAFTFVSNPDGTFCIRHTASASLLTIDNKGAHKVENYRGVGFRAPDGSDSQKWFLERLQARDGGGSGRCSGAVYEVYRDSSLTDRVGEVEIFDGQAAIGGLERNTRYFLKETRPASGHLLSPVITSFQAISGESAVSVANERAGRVPVHFMMVGNDGLPVEIRRASVDEGAHIHSSWPEISAATSDAGAKIGAQRPELAVDGWYRGEQWSWIDWPAVCKGDRWTGERADSEIWLWAKTKYGSVAFYADGTKEQDIVFRSPMLPLGNTYEFPAEATTAAARAYCNLNADFGRREPTGFTGWSLTQDLSSPGATTVEVTSTRTPVYGRNRLTARFEYAPTTQRRAGDGGTYYDRPDEGGNVVADPFALPDFTGAEPEHTAWDEAGSKKFKLPAIGDDAGNHRAVYLGEAVSADRPREVFERDGDGHWRCWVADCWLTEREAAEPGDQSVQPQGSRSFTPRRDETRYVRWRLRRVEGVETFVPGYDPSLFE